jgi:hypothetical protein
LERARFCDTDRPIETYQPIIREQHPDQPGIGVARALHVEVRQHGQEKPWGELSRQEDRQIHDGEEEERVS